MQVERADFVAVPARDGLRLREFYVETLGLRPDDSAQFEVWAGDTGVCHMALFEDPDGNDLMLHRRYAP